jgi:hypothetical protein
MPDTPPKQLGSILQVKVRLLDVSPMVWRRLLVPSLHYLIRTPTNPSPFATPRFSPRRRGGAFRTRRLDLSACGRQRFGAAGCASEPKAIPVASSSPHAKPQTEPRGVQAASRSYR